MAYTRYILINSIDFSETINSCSFSWNMRGGCDTATLAIQGTSFDEFYGIEQGQDVDIRYDTPTGDRWWRGTVSELQTTLDGVLTISCQGTKLHLTEVIPAVDLVTWSTSGQT